MARQSGLDAAIPSADEYEQNGRGLALPPLFRWPGGKRWLLPKLTGFLPDQYGRYFEPFFGAGALFFRLSPTSAVISDVNVDLMACYRAIRDSHLRVSALLRAMDRDRVAYLEIRKSNPTDACERAARFVYLSTLAFNGIHRVNRLGQFNVPYGGRTYSELGFGQSLAKYSQALAHAEIRSGDFERSVDSAAAGDVVYLDPPYTVAHSNNGFLKYNARIFSWSDQVRLATLANDLDRRGCHVIVSNANHSSLLPLYSKFRMSVVPRNSTMAATSGKRGRVEECLFTNDS
jgi:DNA adenine methylase